MGRKTRHRALETAAPSTAMGNRPSPAIALRRAIALAALGATLIVAVAAWSGGRATTDQQIPRVWDEEALKDFELPPPQPGIAVRHIPPAYYYALPERVLHRTHPVYHPDFEPDGYLDSLRALGPGVALDTDTLDTEGEWLRAGEFIFDLPTTFLNPAGQFSTAYLAAGGVPVAADGTFPFHRYIVLPDGQVRLGVGACGNCHTRVMGDGRVLKAVQGNYPIAQLRSRVLTRMRAEGGLQRGNRFVTGEQFVADLSRELTRAPWVDHPSQTMLDTLSVDRAIELNAAIPPGVLIRQGSHYLYPTKVPDLRGVRHQRFLDATGLVRQRSIGDLMRYAALTQFVDLLNRYGDFVPVGRRPGVLPAPDSAVSVVFGRFTRFTDAQLFALATYLYSLEPLPSPHTFDAGTLERGEQVFIEQGCVTCHPPPHYTNNELTPATGFEPSEGDYERLPIFDISVETDPGLTMFTRRGTGYYKVPSLRGLWYRQRMFHDGSLSLEQVLDPARLRQDFVPAGFRGTVQSRMVPGHPFGLELPPADRDALIAYLRTL